MECTAVKLKEIKFPDICIENQNKKAKKKLWLEGNVLNLDCESLVRV